MSDWTWIVVAAFGLLLIWNMYLQSTNERLRRQVELQYQEIQQLREQIGYRYDLTDSGGSLGTLLLIAALIAITWFVASASVVP
jgi:cytochrome b